MKDENPLIRKQAINALGYLLGASDNEKLYFLEQLISILSKDKVSAVRIAAVQILGQREKHPQIMQALTNALEDEDISVRVEAAAAVGKKEEIPAAMDVLINALNHGAPNIRIKAIELLGEKIKNPHAIETLIDTSTNEDSNIKEALTEALEMATGKKFILKKGNIKKWQKWWEKNKKTFYGRYEPFKKYLT